MHNLVYSVLLNLSLHSLAAIAQVEEEELFKAPYPPALTPVDIEKGIIRVDGAQVDPYR